MPQMVLHRTHNMTTTVGHVVSFRAGEPINVPPAAVNQAVSIGAVHADGSKTDLIPDAPKGPYTGPADPVARRDEIIAAMNTLISEPRSDANRTNFGADGQPKPEALSSLLGYKVEKKEIQKVWLERSEMIAGGLLAHDGSKGAAA